MIKVQITNTEDPEMNLLLEGEMIMCSALTTVGNHMNVKSGLVGSATHSGLVDLITSAAKIVSIELGDCLPCKVKATTRCAGYLMGTPEDIPTETPDTEDHEKTTAPAETAATK